MLGEHCRFPPEHNVVRERSLCLRFAESVLDFRSPSVLFRFSSYYPKPKLNTVKHRIPVVGISGTMHGPLPVALLSSLFPDFARYI